MGKKKASFTLIEIMLVMIVSSTLIAILASTYATSLKRGRDGERKSDLNNISNALEIYYHDIGRYPLIAEFNINDMLCNSNDNCTQIYMEKIPKDPSSKQSYYYETDEGGTYYILYSGLEITSDKGNGSNQNGYIGICNPSPCKYGKASTNIDLETFVTNIIPVPPDQYKKQVTPTPIIILASNIGVVSKITPTITSTPTPSPTITIQTNEVSKKITNTPTLTPTPTSTNISNLDYFEIKYEGPSNNTYYPMFNYQILDARCPKGYGVRDINVKVKDISRKDVKFMGCSFNEWSVRNDFGAACAFAADSPFNGELSITCDKTYFNIASYSPSQLSTLPVNNLPALFNLGDWIPQTTEKVNDQQQKMSITCPTGYKATNITCTTHFINYTWLNGQYQIDGLVAMDIDSVRTAACKYDAKNSFSAWIATICEKQ